MKRGDLVRRTSDLVRDTLGCGVVVLVEDAETFDGKLYHVHWARCGNVYWYGREELQNVNKCKDWKKSREKA